MKVLLVGNTQSVHLQRWASALADSGFGVACAGFAELPDVGAIEQHVLPASERGDDRYLRAVPSLRRFVREFAPDVVHAHFVSSYGLMALLASRHRPIVQFAWGSDVLASHLKVPHRILVNVALRRAAGVVVDSADVADAVRVRAGREPLMVPFGPPASWTEAPRNPTRSILSPRGLLPLYNAGVVLEAFATAVDDIDGWHLDMLTGGRDPRALEGAHPELAGRVTWSPFLTRDELQQRYLSAEIVCSVPERDATSVSVLEALASGAFPIVSDLPANRALVKDGVTGLIVPSRDPAALARALVRATGDGDLRAKARAENRRLVADTATWERAVAKVLSLTESVARELF